MVNLLLLLAGTMLCCNLIYPQCQVVNSIADLRMADPGQGNCVQVLGYYTPGDRGGGAFFWQESHGHEICDIENGGTNVNSALPNFQNGQWIRQITEDYLSVLWFGAHGDGQTNDYNSITRALNYANCNRPLEVYFPSGEYLVDTTITIYSKKIRGEHFGRLVGFGTTIRASACFRGESVVNNFRVNQGTRVGVECQLADIIIDANRRSKYAVHLFNGHNMTTLVSNVTAVNAKEAGFFGIVHECEI